MKEKTEEATITVRRRVVVVVTLLLALVVIFLAFRTPRSSSMPDAQPAVQDPSMPHKPEGPAEGDELATSRSALPKPEEIAALRRPEQAKRMLRGIVKNQLGAPLPDAELNLVLSQVKGLEKTAKSSADGTFEIGLDSAISGALRLWCRHSGFARQLVWVQESDAFLQISMVSGWNLRGVVKDAAGKSLAGIPLRVLSAKSGEEAWRVEGFFPELFTQTDDTGSFEFADLPVHPVTVVPTDRRKDVSVDFRIVSSEPKVAEPQSGGLLTLILEKIETLEPATIKVKLIPRVGNNILEIENIWDLDVLPETDQLDWKDSMKRNAREKHSLQQTGNDVVFSKVNVSSKGIVIAVRGFRREERRVSLRPGQVLDLGTVLLSPVTQLIVKLTDWFEKPVDGATVSIRFRDRETAASYGFQQEVVLTKAIKGTYFVGDLPPEIEVELIVQHPAYRDVRELCTTSLSPKQILPITMQPR